MTCMAAGAGMALLYNKFGKDAKKMYKNTMNTMKKDTKKMLNQMNEDM